MHLRQSLEELLPDGSGEGFKVVVLGALFSPCSASWKEQLSHLYTSRPERIKAYVKKGMVYFETSSVENGESIHLTTRIGTVPDFYRGVNASFEIEF